MPSVRMTTSTLIASNAIPAIAALRSGGGAIDTPFSGHRQNNLLCFSVSTLRRVSAAATSSRFGWDDVMRVAEEERVDDYGRTYLDGYFERVRSCNRGAEKRFEFVPFFVEDHIVGYVHHGFMEHLRKFKDVFTIAVGKDGSHGDGHIRLQSSLKTPEERTQAVGDVVKCLGELIPGIRNELYPVTSSFGMPVYFSLERAAAPYFGIKAYGVHMNGYVESDGQKFLWIGKRSDMKPTFPGRLDHLVAGGLPHGISCQENLIKECEEEAGIQRSISINAASVGAISYIDINGYSFKRDVLFCYDLKLPAEFTPKNEDGEVESFRLVPVSKVAKIIQKTDFFKPNCSVVIIDFLFRHGFINPDNHGYLNLLQNLRSGECS